MFKPKQSLGQNFLIDKNILKKIIKNADIHNKNVIEIGPGSGNLTSEIISQNPKSLTLIEKDKNLFVKLFIYLWNINIHTVTPTKSHTNTPSHTLACIL